MFETSVAEMPSIASVAPSDPEIEAMFKAGVHLGHAKSKNHPAMQPYIFGVRNTISLIDLAKTKEKLADALTFFKGIAAKKGLVLLVGTRPAARGLIKALGEKTGMPYFTERWIGGALTNFKVILKRVEYMKELEREKAAGELEKYTKKEQMVKQKELARLVRFFDGLRTLTRLPDALFIVDITHDDTALREARKTKLPIAAFTDTNADAASVHYPIPSNDDALPALTYMIGRIGEAMEEGMREAERTEEAK